MGDHDELPLPRRSSDTQVRSQGNRETHLGSGQNIRQQSPLGVGDTFGDFTLEKYLGEGSSGFVFRALDSVTKRHYALKLICSDPAESLVRTKLGFRRMMRIEHPNLAHADRIHRVGNEIALSMEEIHGKTLATSMKLFRERSREESYGHLLALMREYASALAAMHSHCFIHRDIKPQNLMIDQEGHGRIIDYGLVGTFDAESDPSGLRNYLVGTPRYFAPEALSKQCYLPAGDIYGLGCVILETLRMISANSIAGPVANDQRYEEDTDREEGLQGSGEPGTGDTGSGETGQDEDLQDDTLEINAALEGIADSVPAILHDACSEMLQSDPGERPTAMQVARHGLKTSAAVAWSPEKPMHGRSIEYASLCDWLKMIYGGSKSRLHLFGPSGIGKTRLIDEVEKFLQANPYGHVFRARCRPREDRPLQAFDQIADEIANRYMKNDLQRIRLDPVSVGILHEIFPVLKNIVEVSLDYPTSRPSDSRHDALEAAARMSAEIRKNGPLVIIIDDAQWADPDSLAVLDRLRDTPEGALGILTISRTREDEQGREADAYIELRPLTTQDSLTMLEDATMRWTTDLDTADLQQLAEMVQGNPFRLSELAEEFRTGGLLSDPRQRSELADSIAKGDTLNWLCHRRVENLSSEAKLILPLIVAAGRPVSVEQIGAVSKLDERVDAPLSELVQQRLVADEAQGSECVSVAHDRVSDGLVAILDKETIKTAHQAWADWLLQQDQPHLVAARVAGHLFDADEPSRAISSAVLAAKQSEKLYAYHDAGRWYARIAPLVSGTERTQALRDAARCFENADLPVDAAKHYRELAKFVDDEERIHCQVAAVGLLIRSGRVNEVRPRLKELTGKLKLPTPKGSWLARLSVLWQVANLELGKRRQRRAMVKAARSGRTLSAQSASTRDQQRMALCMAMARPLSLFDNLHASELNLFAARLAQRSDDVKAQLYVAIGSAVFSSYDKGPSRTRGESLLQDLRPRIEALDHQQLLGDYWAASAFTHMFACRWHLISERVNKSVYHYDKMDQSHGFEISNTRWNSSWAQWHLGRWNELAELHDELLSASVLRNDLIQRLEATLGLGAAAWLIRDRPDELIRADKRNVQHLSQKSGVQLFDHLRWISSMQHAIYVGDWEKAWHHVVRYRRLRNRSPLKKMQTFRVMHLHAAALVSLHRMQVENHSRWFLSANQYITALRGEQLDYTTTVASMFEGLHHQILGNTEFARAQLQTANRMAAKTRLRPIQCATSDALERIDTGITGDSLRERMRQQGVVRPDQFERLYTVRITG